MKRSILTLYKNFFLLLFALLFAGIVKVEGANRYAVASGNWNSTATWSATSNGDPGATVPVIGDHVFIQDNNDVTVTADAACTNLTVTGNSNNQTTLLQVNAGFTLVINGDFSLAGGNGNRRAGLTVNGTIQFGGATTFGTSNTEYSVGSSSTIEYNGADQTVSNVLGDYNTLILSGSGTKTFSATIVIASNLSIGNEVVVNLGTFTSFAEMMDFEGQGVLMGSWGSSSSTVTYQNDTYFAATTGRINITTSTCVATAPTTSGALICMGSSATLSASGALVGGKYLWYSAATGGTLLKTSVDDNDPTYTTAVLGATTNFWVSVLSVGGCESSRTLVTATYPSLSTDSQTAAATNSWIGHVYDGTNLGVLYDGDFANYYGSYTENEMFDQSFGGATNCFSITSSSSIPTARSIYTATFSVRYRMNSTKTGLYIADLGSDDGTRLTVDGTLL
jgi:hypothetical protein